MLTDRFNLIIVKYEYASDINYTKVLLRIVSKKHIFLKK